MNSKSLEIYYNLFNVKFATISALINGPIAFEINSGNGNLEALAAGGTQAISSFLSTGFTARLVQHFSPIENRFVSYFFGSTIPATITFLMSLTGHYLNNTSEPLNTCIIPTAVSFLTSFGTNALTRKGYFLPRNYPSTKP